MSLINQLSEVFVGNKSTVEKCPFCGAECRLHHLADGDRVECLTCKYKSPIDIYALRKHNRVSKLVMAEEVYLDKLGVENGHVVCELSSPEGGALHMLAEVFVNQFKESGATNFLELKLTHPEIGDFNVTMQRVNGETPSQQRDKAKAETERLRRALAGMWFAYVNKDPDGLPHMFEESAVKEAEAILGPFGSWPELLKEEGGNADAKGD